jgi:hypothetical protein
MHCQGMQDLLVRPCVHICSYIYWTTALTIRRPRTTDMLTAAHLERIEGLIHRDKEYEVTLQ